MSLSKLSQKELQGRCAWCHEKLDDDEECYGAGTRLKPEGKALISGQEGKLIPMPLSNGQELITIIPMAESKARAAGYDVYFQTCSEECCSALSNAIRDELPNRA
jgi:hypothetical protein